MTVQKILAGSCLLLAFTGCGGGGSGSSETGAIADATPLTTMAAPSPFEGIHPTRQEQLFGHVATVSMMYQALYGNAPSYAEFASLVTMLSAGQPEFLQFISSSYITTSDDAFAKLVLDNLGVNAVSVNAVSYGILLDALGQAFAGYGKAARGQIILNLVNILSTLEGNPVYGAAAARFTAQTLINYSYSTDPAKTTSSQPNVAPIANAGLSQAVVAGASVALDGSNSSDPNLDPLAYTWTLVSKPSGSAAILSLANSPRPTFTADVAGTYVTTLVVNDGKLSSASATSTVTASTPSVTASTPSVTASTPSVTPSTPVINSLTLLRPSNSFFGGSDTVLSMPYESSATASANVTCIGTSCAAVYEVQTFKLVANGQSYTVGNLEAVNMTSSSALIPLFHGLLNGQQIGSGQTITFKLQSPFTRGSTVTMRYSFTIQETGQTFSYTVHLRTN
jgi:hypothetical protein